MMAKKENCGNCKFAIPFYEYGDWRIKCSRKGRTYTPKNWCCGWRETEWPAYLTDMAKKILCPNTLKWWQRLYLRMRYGRKIQKAMFISARGTSKTRLICKMQLGVDPFDLEDEDAEKET